MKHMNYAVLEKVKGQAQDLVQKNVVAFRVGGVSGVMVGIMSSPTMVSFASEATGGSNILEGETLQVITNAFASLGITVTAIVIMAMGATVGVMMLSQACDYALKRMKAAFKKAA